MAVVGEIRIEVEKPDRERASQIPAYALEMLQATWIRCRMAGMQLARDEKFSRRWGWAATVVASVTSLGIFSTLQVRDDIWSRVVVGIVTALAGVLAAMQTKATKDAQAEAQRAKALVATFHPIHENLLAAISDSMRDGKPVDADVLKRAREARDQHTSDMGSEQSTYEQAAESVSRTMRALELIGGKPSRFGSR